MKAVYIFLFSLIAFQMAAQKPSKGIQVKGIVMEESNNSPLEFATVSVFSQQDSSLLTGGITDEKGAFMFDVEPSGPLYAVVEFIGYETKFVDVAYNKGDRAVDMGIITVGVGGIALDEITVRAEKSEMQYSLDKRVFNVGKDLAGRGGSASDVLENIPSVTVGVEGEVSLRGSENVRILINGRPSGMVGLSGTDGLRNIQSSMIERIEIITNPSAKFEAEGMAGIINIILKQDRAGGFNGSFEVFGGLPETYGAGANVNYRKDKLNWFATYNYRKRTGPAVGSSYQEFYLEDATAVSLQDTRRERSGYNHSIRFGSDYLLSDNEVLTAAFLYRYGKDNNANSVFYRDSLVGAGSLANRLTADDFSQYILRTDDELEEEPTLEYSLNYNKKFGKQDHELKADISYQSNDEGESSDFRENLYKNDALFLSDIQRQRSANDEGQRQVRVQLDYTRPFGDKIKTESGLLGTFRQIKNDYLVETLEDDVWLTEEGLSNNFIYNENVIGGYANIGKQFEKFSFLVGARAEYSQIKTELLQTNELNDRDYLNLFPSGFLSYKLSETNTIQASYSRRIRRPRFWDLNPFFTFTDPRNFFSGNPDLDPEYTNSYEVGHLKYWEWGNIGSSVYYRHTTDLISRIQFQDVENQTTIRRPENIGTEDNIGVEFTFAYTGLKWLRLDGGVNGFRFATNGISSEGENLDVSNFAWTSNANARMTFCNNTDLQLRLNYRAPRSTIQGTRKSITSLNLGLSKDATPDLTFTISVRDVFNNRRRRSIIESENYFQESDFQWRPRSINLTINYRINKKKERKRGGGYEGGGEGEF